MFTFLVILALLDAILLSVVVLLQSGKGGGLAGIAAGGQATQILGARQAPDFLEKATWVLGTALLVICFVAKATDSSDNETSTTSGDIRRSLRCDAQPASARTRSVNDRKRGIRLERMTSRLC